MASDEPNGHCVAKPAFLVCGISCRASNARPQQIGALWQQYFQQNVREQISHRANDAIVALYCEYESDHTGEYTIVVGHQVSVASDVPQGMLLKTVPAATYRVIEARGPQPKSVIEAWQHIWSSDLPRTYTGDFDLYLSAELVQVHVAVNAAG